MNSKDVDKIETGPATSATAESLSARDVDDTYDLYKQANDELDPHEAKKVL